MSKANVKITAEDLTQKAFDSVVKSAGKATKTVLALGAATAIAAGGFAIQKTTAYGAALSDLSAITGATGDTLGFLDAQAKKYGNTTTLTASQSVAAMKLIASAKPDLLDNAAALATVTGEVIRLSEASGTDLAAAANTVGESLNQFGAEADQAGRFVNVLAAGAKLGSSEVNNTSAALKKAGTVASNTGLSFEQTNAAIQAMAKVGIKGAEAGTGLRNVLLKLSTQTRDEFNPEIVGFTEAMTNLAGANLSTAEKSKLFGLESIGAANALMQEADSLADLTDKLTGTNVAMEQASIKVDNLAGDYMQLESATEGAALAFGSVLDPWLRSVTQTSTDAAQGLTAFINVMADADEQSALAVQIADVDEQISELKANLNEGTAGNIANVIFGSGGIQGTRDEIAELEKESAALIERRNKLLSAGGPAADAGASPAGVAEVQEEEKLAVLSASAQKEVDKSKEKFEALAIIGAQANDNEEIRAVTAYEKKVEALEAERELLLSHGEWTLENQAANDEAQTALAEKLEADVFKIRKRGMTANEKLAAASASVQIKTVGDMLVGMTASAASGSRTMFEVHKVASLATATVKGIEAVQSAYATGNAIGGPVVGAGFAAVAGFATAANLQKIASTSFGGGGSIGSGGGGGVPSSSNGTALSAAPIDSGQQQASDQETQTKTVNISLEGENQSTAAVRKLIEAINEEIGNGVTLRVQQ